MADLYPNFGGDIISGWGGFCALREWQGVESSRVPYTPIDVANYELTFQYIAKKGWYSGCFGATQRKVVAQDWYAKFNAWVDLNHFNLLKSPTRLFKLNDSVEVMFTLGNTFFESRFQRPPFNAVLGIGDATIPPPGKLVYIPSYRAPLGIITFMKTVDNMDDVLVQEITVEGTSLMWELLSQKEEDTYKEYGQQLYDEKKIP